MDDAFVIEHSRNGEFHGVSGAPPSVPVTVPVLKKKPPSPMLTTPCGTPLSSFTQVMVSQTLTVKTCPLPPSTTFVAAKSNLAVTALPASPHEPASAEPPSAGEVDPLSSLGNVVETGAGDVGDAGVLVPVQAANHAAPTASVLKIASVERRTAGRMPNRVCGKGVRARYRSQATVTPSPPSSWVPGRE